MQTLYILSIFVAWLQAQDTIPSFLLYEDRTEIDLNNGNEVNFLTLKKDMHKEVKRFKDFTLCFRLNFLSYGESEGYKAASIPIWLQSDNFVQDLSRPCYLSECKTDFIYTLFNNLKVGNGYVLFGTFPEHMKTVVSQNKGKNTIFPIYKEKINPYKWHSLCLGTDIENLRVYIVHNGKTQGNYSQPQILGELDDGTDTSIARPFSTIKQWDKDDKEWMPSLTNSLWSGATLAWNHAKFSGYLTDIQLFGRALSAQEMYDVTSCKEFLKGDIYSWDPNDWEPYNKELQSDPDLAVQYRTVNTPLKSLCMSEQKYTFFPDFYDFRGAIDLCRRFGGRMAELATSDKVDAVLNFLGKEIKENDKYDDSLSISISIPYTDVEEDTFFIHYETGLPPEDPLPWCDSQPNGGMVECCGIFGDIQKDENNKYTSYLFDCPCTAQLPVLCEDVGEIVLEIRGMCEFSKIDTTYMLVEGDINKKRFFAGKTGWRLFWDIEDNSWKLRSPKRKQMYATHTEFSTYPLGKKSWKIVNDTQCVYSNPDNVELNISPCNSSAFTCDDGSCIPMDKRLVVI